MAFLPYVRRRAAFAFCRDAETAEGGAYVRHFFGTTRQKAAWGVALRSRLERYKACV